MKKLLLALFLAFPSLAFANTQVPAQNVSSTVPGSPRCLSGATNVQAALNQLDACSGSFTPGSPSGSFQYNNSGIFTGGNMYQDSNGNIGINTVGPRSNFSIVETNGYDAIHVGENSQSLFKVTASGNVGIGSASPGQALDVSGTVRGIQFIATGTPPGQPGYFQWLNNYGGISASNVLYTDGTSVFSTTLQGNVEINGTTATLNVPGSIQSTGPGGYVEYPQVPTPGNPAAGYDRFFFQSGDIPSYQTSGGQTLTFPSNVWNGANPIYVTGINVGIGSQYPGKQLDIIGTARATYFIGNGSGLTNLLPSFWVSGNVGINTTSNVGIGSTNPGQSLDVNGTVRALYFRGNGSNLTNLPPAFWVTGNVGINTTSNVGIGSINPGQSLDVNGTVRATNFSGAGTGLTGTASGLTAGVVSTISGLITNGSNITISGSGTSGSPYSISSSGGGGGGFIQSPGNVGINTTQNVGIGSVSPTVALDIVGTEDINGSAVCTANGSNCPAGGTNPWLVKSGSGNLGISTVGPYNVGIGTTIGNGALVVMSGNVGIGTWNPTALFQVGSTSNTWTSSGAISASGAISSGGNLTAGGATTYGAGGVTVSSAASFTITNNASTANIGTVISGNKNTGTFVNLSSTGVGVTGNTDSINMIVGNVGIGTITAISIHNGGNVGIGTLGVGNVGIGTFNMVSLFSVAGNCKGLATATILCSCNASGGIGYCTGSLTGDVCSTCTCC